VIGVFLSAILANLSAKLAGQSAIAITWSSSICDCQVTITTLQRFLSK